MLKRKLISVLLPALALSTGIANAELPSFSANPTPVFFFEQEVPSQVKATSSVTISKDVYRDGNSSLKWDFKNGSVLDFNVPFTVEEDDIKPRNFTIWVYVDAKDASKDNNLTFSFKSGKKEIKKFNIKLDFTGWRGVAVPYRDMPGADLGEKTEFSQIEVRASGAGAVYFDQVFLNAKIDNRWSIPDRHLDFINPKSQTAVNNNWNGLYTYDKLVKAKFPSFDFKSKFDDTTGPSANIYKQADFVNGINPDLEVSSEQVKKLEAEFDKFGFKVVDGKVQGPRMEFPTRLDYLKDKDEDANLSDEAKAELLASESFTNLRVLGRWMDSAAKYLRSNKLDAQDRARLEEDFINGFKFLVDQGFVGGSSYQIIHHLGYQDRELFSALFVMRHLLAEKGLLEEAQSMMMWYTGCGRIFETNLRDANADILNTQLQWMLESILLLPNQEQRDSLLETFSTWLSKTILTSKGIGGGFKSDGTVFHHGQHYPAYGIDSLRGLAPTVYMLAGTKFALSEAADKQYHHVLNTFNFYTKGVNIPIALSGRHPTERFKVDTNAYKWAALADILSGNGDQMAGIYAAKKGLAEFEGVKAAQDPQGVKALPWSSSLVVRGATSADADQSWLAIARGYSRYLPGNEAYGANNRYSRNGLYGKFEIIPSDFEKRSFRHDGFDWRFYDGTTAIFQSFEDLKSQLNQLPGGGVEEMLLSDQTYSGANTLGKDVGLFAQRVHGHAKYNQENFWANKSYFVFGNNVVALGSDIQSDDKANPVYTTLVQQFIDGTEFVYNKKALEDESYERLDQESVLVSPNGVTYYVPAKSGLVVEQAVQTTPDDRNDKDTKGRFAKAYLDHGKAVKDGTYEYSMVIEPVKNQGKLNYKVLRQDATAHVVNAPSYGVTGYAMFKAGSVNVPGQALKAVSAPSLVLLSQDGNKVALSVVNPDLNLYQGVEKDQVTADGKQQEVISYSRTWFFTDSQPLTTTYTLDGAYQLDGKAPEGVKVSTDGSTTKVEVTASEAKEVKVNLVRK